VPHGIAFEPLRLFHPQSPYEDGKGGDNTEPKGETPDSPEVVGSEAILSDVGSDGSSRERQ